MLSTTELELMNDELRRDYGLLYEKPRFRVVWSNDQFETRVGKVADFYGSIFVRETSGAHYLPKYGYLKDRYILEYLVEGLNSELLADISYEPLWTFEDKNGQMIIPVPRAVKFVVNCTLNPNKLSPSSLQDKEKEDFEKEVNFFEDYLAGEGSYIATMLANKEAVVNQWSKE